MACLQISAQSGVGALDLIAGYPAGGYPGIQGAGDHPEQFDVLGRRRLAQQHKPAAKPIEDQIQETKGHGRSSCPAAAQLRLAIITRIERTYHHRWRHQLGKLALVEYEMLYTTGSLAA